MGRFPRHVAIVAGAAALGLAAPAAAQAPPPPSNDNYLASTTILGSDGATFPREYADRVDTTAATVQADLFDPDREGNPLGGAGPETTTCGAAAFGKTVWWDFAPPVDGGVEMQVSGFDSVVAVYEWDAQTALITDTVWCQDDAQGPTESVVLPEVRGGRNYTVQVGGRTAADGTPAGGLIDFSLTFFPDTDGDGVLDELPDKCLRIPGIPAAGGCPPGLDASPSITYDSLIAGGVVVRRLFVTGVPKGARVEARCRRCGVRAVREVHVAPKRGRITFSKIVGTTAPPGASLEVLVTRSRTGSGRFRFGAIGDYFRWPVVGNALGARVKRCLPVGSTKPRRRCT